MTRHETTTETIEIIANGEPHEISAGLTVHGFLVELGLDPDVVVVERNGEILSRSRFAEVPLGPGDALEIVHFVGGG